MGGDKSVPTMAEDRTKHITFQKGQCVPQLTQCTKCCDRFHCPFCSATVFKPTRLYKLKIHLKSHFNKAVVHQGFTIHRCGLGCRPSLHFHCPHCQITILRKSDFENHLFVCKHFDVLASGAPSMILEVPQPTPTTEPIPPSLEIPPPPSPSAFRVTEISPPSLGVVLGTERLKDDSDVQGDAPFRQIAAPQMKEELEMQCDSPFETVRTVGTQPAVHYKRSRGVMACPQTKEVGVGSDVPVSWQQEEPPAEIEVELTASMMSNPSAGSQQTSRDLQRSSESTQDVSNKAETSYWKLSKELVRELIFHCWECSSECRVQSKGEGGNLSLTQECPVCSNYRVWSSKAADKFKEKEDESTLSEEDADPEEEEDTTEKEEDSLHDTEEDIDMDPADSDYLPSSECESSESSNEDEIEESVSQRPFQKAIRPVVWCVRCEALAGTACTTRKHRRVYGCPRCVSDPAVEIRGLMDATVQFDNRISFHRHAIAAHDAPREAPKYKTCDDCGKSNRVESDSDMCECKIKPYSCSLCPKRFRLEPSLKQHHRVLHGKSTYVCKYCMMKFEAREHKLEHEKFHSTRGLPYSCSNCPKRFASFTERNRHLETHGQQKSCYLCSTCGLRFRRCTNYRRHMLVHSGVKPYACPVCRRSFNQSGHLKSHMRLHTGEKPFACEHCGQSFNHNVSLKKHLQRRHGDDDATMPATQTGTMSEGKRVGRPVSNFPPKNKNKERNKDGGKQSSADADEDDSDVEHQGKIEYDGEEKGNRKRKARGIRRESKRRTVEREDERN